MVESLAPPDARARAYTVKLRFIEPDGLAPGERRFDVALQGQPVLRDFDIAQEAGGAARGLVKEFRGVRVTKDLTVTLTPAPKPSSHGPGNDVTTVRGAGDAVEGQRVAVALRSATKAAAVAAAMRMRRSGIQCEVMRSRGSGVAASRRPGAFARRR